MDSRDDRFVLPSRATRDDTLKRMNTLFKSAYGSLESHMLGVGPEHRVQRLRESLGAPAPQMMGIAAMLEADHV